MMVTNPDMLHLSILPCHGEFAALLSNLKYVVIDEVSHFISSVSNIASMMLNTCNWQNVYC